MSELLPSDKACSDLRKVVAEYQRRIQQSIFRISEKVTRTEERHRLDCYIRHCSPVLAQRGESQLPSSLRRMPTDADRTATMIYPGILFFHVGNAIVTFYDFVLGLPVLDALERRVKLLEEIAKKGPRQFRVAGTERDGFELVHKDEQPMPFQPTPFFG